MSDAAFALSMSSAQQSRGQGRFAEARAACGRALSVRPNDPDALVLAGLIEFQLGRPAEAHALLTKALSFRPADVETWLLLSGLEAIRGNAEAAIEGCQRAVTLDAKSVAAHLQLGGLLVDQRRWAEACECFRRAIALDPRHVIAHVNLGSALFRAGRPDAAAASQREVLAFSPDHPIALKNLAAALRAMGEFDSALDAYRRVVALRPDYAEARRDLGLLLLHREDYAEGWREYEWRWRTATQGAVPLEGILWDGQQLESKRLLLHFEQGYGDTIQFLRYVPIAAQRAATTLCVPDALLKVAQASFSDLEIVAASDGLPRYDRHAYLMSLPGLLGLEKPACPAGMPYLAAPVDRVAAWTTEIPNNGRLRVGIAWAGNPTQEHDVSRSMPVAALEPLLAVPDIEWFSLQKDASPPQGVTDLAAKLTDFAETAAAMMRLDLVISIDSAVCHLAGALGRPTWALLSHVPDWRWGRESSDSAWYPTARLFRQARRGDWAGPVTAAAEALAHMTGKA